MEQTYQPWELESEGMAPPASASAAGIGAHPFPLLASTPSVPASPAVPRSASIRMLTRELLETIVLTVVVFFLIRTVVANFRIESYSMEPNLYEGQFILVDKLVYHYLHPLQRGDIVVLEYAPASDQDLIKRVIGLPGEKVQVRTGRVWINDQPLQEPYIAASPSYNWGPQVLGPKDYFVLGDNRNRSSDSHIWGVLPESAIVGRAFLTYWPPQRMGLMPNSRVSFASGDN